MPRTRETGPALFDRRCEECGSYLQPTPSGYLACPRGHGKLCEPDAGESSGQSYPDEFPWEEQRCATE